MVMVLGINLVRFRRLGAFVNEEVTKVAEDASLLVLLMGCAGIKHPLRMLQARTWLLKYTPPEVSFDPKLDFSRPAEFRPADRWHIHFSWYVAQKFEEARGKGVMHAQSFVRATILHEMVHFLDFWHDEKLLDANKGRFDPDQGDLFERRAFGGEVDAQLPWDRN